jgi:hypothetical protein
MEDLFTSWHTISVSRRILLHGQLYYLDARVEVCTSKVHRRLLWQPANSFRPRLFSFLWNMKSFAGRPVTRNFHVVASRCLKAVLTGEMGPGCSCPTPTEIMINASLSLSLSLSWLHCAVWCQIFQDYLNGVAFVDRKVTTWPPREMYIPLSIWWWLVYHCSNRQSMSWAQCDTFCTINGKQYKYRDDVSLWCYVDKFVGMCITESRLLNCMSINWRIEETASTYGGVAANVLNKLVADNWEGVILQRGG